MKKLVASALLASLMTACATQPPAVTDSAKPVDNSATATTPAAADATPSAEAQKAAAEQALKEQALKDEQAKAESDKRMQDNMLKANSVYFGFNQFNIDDDYKSIIDTHANFAKSSNAKVRVEGNTDERGSREYNLALGQKRANAVANALEVLGVPKSSIESVSFGEEKPRAEGADEDAWSVNRRADIVYPK